MTTDPMRPKTCPMPPKKNETRLPMINRPRHMNPTASVVRSTLPARPIAHALTEPVRSCSTLNVATMALTAAWNRSRPKIATSPAAFAPRPVASIAARNVLPAICGSADVVSGGSANVTLIVENGPSNPNDVKNAHAARMTTGTAASSHRLDRGRASPRPSVDRRLGIGDPPGARGARMLSRSPRRGAGAGAGARYEDGRCRFFLLLMAPPPDPLSPARPRPPPRYRTTPRPTP